MSFGLLLSKLYSKLRSIDNMLNSKKFGTAQKVVPVLFGREKIELQIAQNICSGNTDDDGDGDTGEHRAGEI